MMDKNGTADSVILVDFDLASYGFPALDLACLMFYSSVGCKRLTNDLRGTLLITLIQVKNTWKIFLIWALFQMISSILFWKRIWFNLNLRTGLFRHVPVFIKIIPLFSLSLTEVRKRFDIHLVYVIFCKLNYWEYHYNSFSASTFMYSSVIPMKQMKWCICELERLQIQFDHPNPIRHKLLFAIFENFLKIKISKFISSLQFWTFSIKAKL